MGILSFGQNLASQKAQAYNDYARQLQGYYDAQASWEINKRQADDRKKQLDANAIYQMQQLDAAQMEANEAATEQKSQIARDMLRAKAQAQLAASEAGVGGNSADRILADINFTEQSKLGAVESSRENQISALQTDKHNVRQSTEMVPIYAAIGGKPKYKGNSMVSYLSAAMSGLSTYAGLSYNPSQPAQVSQVSSTLVRNPKLVNPCGR